MFHISLFSLLLLLLAFKNPTTISSRLLFKVLLGHILEALVAVGRGHISALLDAGSLQHSQNPLVQDRELLGIDTRRFYEVVSLSSYAHDSFEGLHILPTATQPQQEMSAIVTRSPTR